MASNLLPCPPIGASSELVADDAGQRDLDKNSEKGNRSSAVGRVTGTGEMETALRSVESCKVSSESEI